MAFNDSLTLTSNFFIRGKDAKDAYTAIEGLEPGSVPEASIEELKNAFKSKGWGVGTSGNNITSLQMHGNTIGDEDEELFRSVAPFVKPNSWMEFWGQRGTHFRWVFENGDMKEFLPDITWNEVEEDYNYD